MSAPRGFTYWVSDEQLARFGQATIEQRLEWLEQMRTLTWELASDDVRKRWRALRAGRAIDDDGDPSGQLEFLAKDPR